ncbi:hypothetical protein PGT21_015909 [Puccinia graminis f. sp. tritici]|uniref:Uncharacterized protein n=1 Tax=Puccinia graminis f. sp. tritici TaxID=56615 RepID=A0A5B0MAE4_PUCGR|nr:hypothetical protein PGT21_015909 [Puccinia graminis f. sp. tritici]
MPKRAAPECPPTCQSDVLRSVFEEDNDNEDDDERELSLHSRVNRVFQIISGVRLKLPKTPSSSKFLSHARLRSFTLSRRNSKTSTLDRQEKLSWRGLYSTAERASLGSQEHSAWPGGILPAAGTGINTHYLPLTTLKKLSQLIVTTFLPLNT